MNELITLEIERGDEALKSAETLLTAGLYRDAMSRTYYAVLHYARALLATKECFPKSHHGVMQLRQELLGEPAGKKGHKRLVTLTEHQPSVADSLRFASPQHSHTLSPMKT